MPLSPLERKAEFKKAVTLKGTTAKDASRNVIGVTWVHLSLGLDEENTKRRLSDEVKRKFAKYIGRSVKETFGDAA